MIINNQPNTQATVLAGATLVSTFHSVKNLAQVLVGKDNIDTRKANWSQASKQEGYLGAISKRIQFFTGSDPLSARVASLVKGAFMAAASIVMCDLLNTNSSNSSKIQDLENELATINTSTQEAKALAGIYIEECLIQNQKDNTTNFINCMAKIFPTFQRQIEELNAQVQSYKKTTQGLESSIESQSAHYNECLESKSTVEATLVKSQNTIESQEAEINKLNQRIQQLSINLDESSAKNANYTYTIGALSKDIQELGHLQQLVNQLQPANAELDEKLANSAKVLEQAVKENGDLKLQHLSELEAMQEKLDNCANVLEQAVKENGALKLQHSSELKAMQEKLDALKTKANTQG